MKIRNYKFIYLNRKKLVQLAQIKVHTLSRRSYLVLSTILYRINHIQSIVSTLYNTLNSKSYLVHSTIIYTVIISSTKYNIRATTSQ